VVANHLRKKSTVNTRLVSPASPPIMSRPQRSSVFVLGPPIEQAAPITPCDHAPIDLRSQTPQEHRSLSSHDANDPENPDDENRIPEVHISQETCSSKSARSEQNEGEKLLMIPVKPGRSRASSLRLATEVSPSVRGSRLGTHDLKPHSTGKVFKSYTVRYFKNAHVATKAVLCIPTSLFLREKKHRL
jgi:hypothetical protein